MRAGALKTNDQAALQTALEAWYANAHDIAVFLSGAIPTTGRSPRWTK